MKYPLKLVLLFVTFAMLYILNFSVRSFAIQPRSCSFDVNEKSLISRPTFCSPRANQRGSRQKIISISLFGATENPEMFESNRSFVLLEDLIRDMQHVYSDQWILRVYHDEKFLSSSYIDHIQSNYLFVDFCNITWFNLSYLPPKIWRFLPAIDPSVSIMASRDLDSPLFRRERIAIDEWLQSKLTFHSMRDHPFHYAPVLGGMWAFRVENDRTFSNQLREKLFDRNLIANYSLNRDQVFLADHIWPYAKERTMTHASYWCKIPNWNFHHRPFPTQRPSINKTHFIFVGCPRPKCFDDIFLNNSCPNDCRPKENTDWIFC